MFKDIKNWVLSCYLQKVSWFAMSISPISSSMMSMYVPSAGASKTAEKDTEYQQIIKKLAAYGIASSGDKETDKTRLETAEKLMATEHQRIVQELAAYGIPSSGDNETDKTRLEVVERLIAMQESQQTLGERDSIPFEDIMNTLNLTITGDLEDDYDTTIDKLDYEIYMAYTDEEREYYEALKDQVELEYNSSKENRISYFSGASQLGSVNRYMLGI